MNTIPRQPTTPAPPEWWSSLADILDFSPRQSRLFWCALSASTDPRLKALTYRCHAHEQYLSGQRLNLVHDGRTLTDFLRTTWSPHQMCVALEALHRGGLLNRQDCNLFQAKFLIRTDRDGRWAIPHKKE